MTQIDPTRAAMVIGAILSGWRSRPATIAPIETTEHVDSPAPTEQPGQVGRPVEGQIVSGFGPRGGRQHQGVDIAVPTGTTILAATSGTVIHAASDDPNGYGTWVEIQADDGTTTRYGHLSQLSVKVGDKVTIGSPIGLSGATGNARGPHLHFEIRQGGKPVDPAPFLASSGPIVSTLPQEPTPPPDPLAVQVQTLESTLRGEPVEDLPPEPTSSPKENEDTPTDFGNLDKWIRWAMAKKGVDESWYEGLYNRAMVESGGKNIPQSPSVRDINMQRGTPAFGPWQFIESTFRRFAEPGYEDWRNPYHQALAIINAVMKSPKYGGHPRGLPRTGGWSP